LKKELELARKTTLPKWVKANKSVEKKAKKLGPKAGHVASKRKRPEKVDIEIELIAEDCPCCHASLESFPHKWHSHDQIDLPSPSSCVVTRYNVGWSWCKSCKKEVSPKDRLLRSKYGPRLHAQVSY